jgi:NAD(P)H-hydrate epimerase
MENAGRHVACELLKASEKNKKVLVVCGLGNNAGDGFVAARHLVNQGVKVKIWLIGRPGQLRGDARINYLILKKLKYPVIFIGAHSRVPVGDIKQADAVIDAIFGVGLNREIGEPFKGVIDLINKCARRIISIDVPSGLDGTTGKRHGACVKADKTVTFTFLKKGFLLNDGPRMTGKVVVVDIGIPKQLKDKL